jgi:hypothetical protein
LRPTDQVAPDSSMQRLNPTPREIHPCADGFSSLASSLGELVFPMLVGGISHHEEAPMVQGERDRVEVGPPSWCARTWKGIAVAKLKRALRTKGE